ncbi:MAG: YitT family protein [Bacillota bacterium]
MAGNKVRLRERVADIAALVGGTAMIAAGLAVFTIPNNIAPGGVSGLATAIAYATGWPVGMLTLVLNIPLWIAAWRMFGVKPLVRTMIATALLSLLIDGFTPVIFTYSNNVLLASVMGGACMGLGMGVLFLRGFNTGGTDLLMLLLRKRFAHIPMGKLLMMLDACVVLIAVLIFRDIEIALYSGVAIFCAGKVVDALMQGVDFAKVLLVITDDGEAVAQYLMRATGRGVTVLPARGAYTGEQKSMLMTAVRRGEVTQTLKAIKQADPRAFVILHNATEVHGEGFKENTL